MISHNRVSVILPVRNGIKYIATSINSVLKSNYPEIELIVIDDGSTDGTKEVINNLLLNNNFIHIENAGHGICDALNTGIRTATGNYIARMDADDICLPNRFTNQVNFLKANKDISLVGGQVKLFGEKNGVSSYPLTSNGCRSMLFFTPCCAHPTYMIDRSRFDIEDLIYCKEDNLAQDFEFLCRNSFKHNYANLSEIVLEYRMHPEQATKKSDLRLKRISEFLPKFWGNFYNIEEKSVMSLAFPWSKINGEFNSPIKPLIRHTPLFMYHAVSFHRDRISIPLLLWLSVRFQIAGVLKLAKNKFSFAIW